MQDENQGPGWEEARLRFRGHLLVQGIVRQDARFLLAVSGGMDSMCMLALFDSCGLDFDVAHVNYGLRGDASDADAALVRDTCHSKSIVLHERKIDVRAVSSSGDESLQQAGRRLRYTWFEELQQKHHYDFICTAHHQNDSAETFFVHLIRGTGLKGLTGIPVLREHILRPLLCFSREEIAHLVSSNEILYRDDTSNSGRDYLRNRIRHDVIPLFEAERPAFIKRMHTTQQRLVQEYAFMDAQLKAIRRDICAQQGDGIALDLIQLLKQASPAVVLHSILKDFGFSWLQCQGMITQSHAPGARYITGTHELCFGRNMLLVQPLQSDARELALPIEPGGVYHLPEGSLTLERIRDIPDFSNDPCIEYADASKFTGKMQMRRWKEGDFFYPLGMQGRQKLQDYFTNQKISAFDKENIWLVVDGDDVVWIVGMRLDDRYKISQVTSEVLRMEWRPSQD